MSVNYENIINSIESGNKMDWTNALNRLQPVPIDITSIFRTYNDAVVYAASNPVAYQTQIVCVAENDSAYIITGTPYPNATNIVEIEGISYNVYLKPISSSSSGGSTSGGGSVEINTDVLIIDGGNAQIAIEGWPDILDEIDAKSEEIFRLQEIIAGLDSENEDQQQLINDLNAEIERLRNEIEELAEQINESTPTPDVDIDGDGNITIPDPNNPSENIKVLAGDFDGNGKVNNKDYGLLMQYLQGEDLSSIELHIEAVDFNNNSRPDAKDLATLMKLLNGWSV